MYGQNNNNQNYGWGNAVADILGAVMKRNADRGEMKKQAKMYGDVANFGNNLNNLDYGGQTTTQDLASRSNPNSNYMSKNIEQQSISGMKQQGLLPSTDFLGQQGTTDNIGKGLFNTNFNPQTPTASLLGQGLLRQPLQQPVQQPNNIQQALAPGQSMIDKYSQANNPVLKTTSAPKTLQEQTRVIKSQFAPAMKDLIGKYGKENAREIVSLLKQSMQDKIDEHTSNYQQQQVNDLYQGFITEENPNKKAMYAARLKNLGYDVTTPYKEFAPDYVDKVVDSGDAQNLLSFDKKSGKYYDGGKLAKSVSPDARLNADTRIQTTGMNNATTLQAAAMRSSGGGRSSKPDAYWSNYENHGALDRDQALVNEYQQKVANDDYISPTDQTKYNTAASKINAYWKASSGGEYDSSPVPSQNYIDADRQIAQLKAAHPEATNEEIIQFLNSRIQGGK